MTYREALAAQETTARWSRPVREFHNADTTYLDRLVREATRRLDGDVLVPPGWPRSTREEQR